MFYFALTYIGAVLLFSGVGHAVRLSRFCEVIREHSIVPTALAGVVALGVCALELAIGVAAFIALAGPANMALRASVCIGAAGMGAAFWVYLRQLLRNPGVAKSCGCSPLSAPLTRVSVVPAIGLVVMALCGLPFVGQTTAGEVLVVLPTVWGATLAAVMLLYPASVFQPGHA